MKKTKRSKTWHLDESASAGAELRQFALGIIAQDENDVIALTISDYLRILSGFACGFALLTANNILDADESTSLRQSITCLDVIADSADRRRTVFGDEEVLQAQ